MHVARKVYGPRHVIPWLFCRWRSPDNGHVRKSVGQQRLVTSRAWAGRRCSGQQVQAKCALCGYVDVGYCNVSSFLPRD